MPAVLNNAIDWLSRPYGAGALVGKPFGVIGATPTPYGGKWAHATRPAPPAIAGAVVVEDVTVSQSASTSTCSPTPRCWAGSPAPSRALGRLRRRDRRGLSPRGRGYGRVVAELHDLTALEQGDLVRRARGVARSSSPSTTSNAPTVSTTVGAFVTLTADLARDRAAAPPSRPAGRRLAAVRRADRDQGPQPDRRACAPPSARRRSPTSCRTSPTGSRSRSRRPGMVSLGKTATPEFGSPCYTEPEGRPAGGHPVGPDPDGRRLLRRRGRGGRRRPGPGRPGLRRRRLDPDPGLLLRAGRPQAHARADQWSPHVRRPGGSGDGRADRPDRARRGGDARRARRSSGGGSVLGTTSFRDVPGGVRPRSGAASDRAVHRASDRRRRRGPGVRARPGRTPRGCWSRSATRSSTSPCRCRAEAVPVFETCWAVLTALSVVPPEREHLLRPLTRWLTERGRAVSGPEFGLAIGAMRRFAAGALTALAPYDAVLTPTLAHAAAAGRRDPRRRRPGARTSRRRRVHARGPRRGTSPACRPSRCRCTGPTDGLPVGVMLAARPAEEELLLALCAQVEAAAPWADRRPPGW